jgi:hypothetical protein
MTSKGVKENEALSDIPEDEIEQSSLQEEELCEHSDDIWKVENLDNYVDDHIHSRRFNA